MSRIPFPISRPALALALSLGLIGLAVGVVAAKPGGDCKKAIAGTYYAPADFFVTLDKDGGAFGQFSLTSQENVVGMGETFSGKWTCKGTSLTLQDFRFFDDEGFRGFEQTDATAIFDGVDTLTFSYTFHSYPETATAADIRAGTGATVFTFGPQVVERISTL